jgi:hypothetical protein
LSTARLGALRVGDHELVVSGDDSIALPGEEVHSDAHHHGCGGARRDEAVYRLSLDPDWIATLEPTAALEISTEQPGVGLAVRAPGCLPDQEIACTPPGDGAAQVLVEDLAALTAAGTEPFLFVERPAASDAAPDEPPEAVSVALKAVDG